jgi:hypothetical protein
MRINVIYQHPAGADSNVDSDYLEGFRRDEIKQVYMIDANRPATEKEIKEMLSGEFRGI